LKGRISAEYLITPESRQDDLKAVIVGVLRYTEGVKTINTWLVGSIEEFVKKRLRNRRIETPVKMSGAKMFGRLARNASFVESRIVEGNTKRL
jgi:hypothetical protein